MGVTQCVNFPTCNQSSQDLVVCSSTQSVEYIHAGEPASTNDHSSIVYGMKCHPHHSTEHVSWLNFKGADYTAINTFLISLDWSEIYRDCTCAEDYYLAFKSIIGIVINNFVPLVDRGETVRRDVPWFDVKFEPWLRAKQREVTGEVTASTEI